MDFLAAPVMVKPHLMKLVALLGTLAVTLASALASGPRAVLLAPTETVPAGREATLSLTFFNDTAEALSLGPAERLEGALVGPDGRRAAVLRARQTSATASVPPGGFVATDYLLAVPAEAAGLLVVELRDERLGPLRAVLHVGPADHPLPSVLSPATAEPAASPADRISAQRTFAGRFAAHEPVYFIYGPDAPGAKFQFSFKYRLLSFDAGEGVDGARTASRLQFGYTQRSLWDIDAESSPFYDSSYMPSLFYELIATPEKSDGGLNWLGFQGGFQHESNGRDGLDSRSLNTLFLRTGLVAGRMEGWHLTASLRGYAYVTSLSDNEDLEDYRGYADWLLTLSHGNGTMLAYTGRAGRGFERFSTQLDLTVPVRFRLFDFATYFLVQYFNGYGESLRSYQTKSETIRAGFSFVR